MKKRNKGLVSVFLCAVLFFGTSCSYAAGGNLAFFNQQPTSEETSDITVFAAGERAASSTGEVMVEGDVFYQPLANTLESASPARWDSRWVGKVPPVADQGSMGTCWAFTALHAVEASLLPDKAEDFSVDHLVAYNGFDTDMTTGGSTLMSTNYMLNWHGPVSEAEDPYNDGVSNPDAAVLYHVQQVRWLISVDAVKAAVVRNGAVQTSIYLGDDVGNLSGSDAFYNADEYAYYYTGSETPNHDLLIVGWDDEFPASSFSTPVPGDGAFICQNTWGTGFGRDGYFYVSYYDQNVTDFALTYDRVEPADNYDALYAWDELGYCANTGYDQGQVWGADVFTATADQNIVAAGFYSLSDDMDYTVYVVTDPDFSDGTLAGGETLVPAASGTVYCRGYYTIPLDEPVAVSAGQTFAVIVKMQANDDCVQPLAVEMTTSFGSADVLEGHSYISDSGQYWSDTVESVGAEACIKAYADNR